MMNLKLALILILSSMAVIFIVQNVAVVEIGFLFWRASMSGALLICFTLMIGFVLGWFSHSYLLYRKAKSKLVYLG
ncbi:MAG: LapA family protein [Gallionella sp.]|nr:LapA family protein [Gallionella sp.]